MAMDLVRGALAAVEPAAAVREHVRRDGDILTIDRRAYDLREIDHIYMVGAGKAAAPMAQAIEEIVGDRLADGVISVRYGQTVPLRRVRTIQAGHPIPDDRSVEAAQSILDLCARAGRRDFILALISGGGSALMVAPILGVTLADKRRLTNQILRSGATITEINAVRKHLSRVKGGGLVRAAAPAEVCGLILSDVVGSPIDTIASGPTAPDQTSFADARAALESHGLLGQVPSSIQAHLDAGIRGDVPETPKTGDPIFQRVHNVVVGSNEIAARALARRAQSRGLNTLLLTTFVEGEAREAGTFLGAVAREVAMTGTPVARPACVIVSGETTVTVRGRGRGGRAQEFALAAASKIADLADTHVIAFTTDGVDGPTDVAGAMVDGTTMARAGQIGLSASAALADNDSYTFFERLGDHIKTGPTNTNVADVMFALVL